MGANANGAAERRDCQKPQVERSGTWGSQRTKRYGLGEVDCGYYGDTTIDLSEAV